jgi:hypothetical protein
MIITDLVIPNLAVLGVKRRGDGIAPDLQTIWLTPYPVITRYVLWCKRMGWAPFGTGNMRNLGGGVGVPTSGYRDLIINGRTQSPHLHAFALDCYVPAQLQKDAAIEADRLFARVGICPDRKFMHIDLAPESWIAKYGARRYWVQRAGQYLYADTLGEALDTLNLE